MLWDLLYRQGQRWWIDMTGKSQGTKQKCEIVQIQVKAVTTREMREDKGRDSPKLRVLCTWILWVKGNEEYREKRQRKYKRDRKWPRDIAKKTQRGTKESLDGVSLFLKQFWSSYKIPNCGENITEREGVKPQARPESIRDWGSMAEALATAQKHRRESQGGSMAAPAPASAGSIRKREGVGQWSSQPLTGSFRERVWWQLWQPESIDSSSLQELD